jgi:hypothetical protein
VFEFCSHVVCCYRPFFFVPFRCLLPSSCNPTSFQIKAAAFTINQTRGVAFILATKPKPSPIHGLTTLPNPPCLLSFFAITTYLQLNTKINNTPSLCPSLLYPLANHGFTATAPQTSINSTITSPFHYHNQASTTVPNSNLLSNHSQPQHRDLSFSAINHPAPSSPSSHHSYTCN